MKQYIQQFGSSWTQEKLDIFSNYLEAYLQALKNRKFKKIYIDAFAGTGEIITQDEKVLIGSAKRALSAKKLFDRYYFIEADKKKCDALIGMINRDFPHLLTRVTVRHGDANIELASIVSGIDWRFNRGLLFLDPCATQVNWTTLESIAATKAIDVWYLFPFSALNRLLKKDGNLDPAWSACIDRLLGDKNWRKEFYKQDDQLCLFDIINTNPPERLVKTADSEMIQKYILGRLQSIFAEVSKKPRIFKNEKNSPLFLFCFAVSNPSVKARALALRIADQILGATELSR
jgi:three-Cys-motif partner protein